MERDLTPLADGWARWHQSDLDAEIELRFAPQADGRLEPVEMRVSATERLTGANLRAIQLGRAEAAANDPEMRPLLHAGGHKDVWAMQRPAMPDYYEGALHLTVEGRILDAQSAGEVRTARFEGRLDPETGRVIGQSVRREKPDLRLPTTNARKRPDSFYQEVAVRYHWLSQETKRPAAELAEANNVPDTTVHRWIKEARRRGFLAPGRQGRAG